MKLKRRPNHSGTIKFLSGNRLKPYAAMVRDGVRVTGEGRAYAVYRAIGYFKTEAEAFKALSVYNPGALVYSPRFDEVYNAWVKEYEQKKPLPKMYEAAYRKLSVFYAQKIRDLRTIDLENFMSRSDIARTMKAVCVVVLHGIYDYAERHEYVEKNYARLAKFNLDTTAKIVRHVYTPKEVEALSKSSDYFDRCQMVLLYTGMRVSEFFGIRIADVHLEEHYMVGGNKTKAGKNRIIPIHPAIEDTIATFLRQSKMLGSEYAFATKNGRKGDKDALYSYMQRTNSGHTPHDTRHTFASQAYLCGMDENIIKRIVGHQLNGVTQQVYIHLGVDALYQELLKYHF